MRILITLFTIALFSCGGSDRNRVRINLPLPPKLNLANYHQLYIGGFIASDQNKDFDSQLECINFFKREFIRKEAISIVERAPIDMNDRDPREFFAAEQLEWSKIDETLEKDGTLVLTGEVSYEILDRSGFRQVSTTDITGNRYNQTRFVEATGYLLKLRVYVYDMNDGKMLYRELLQDEIDVDGPPGDTRLAFNALLDRMSQNVLGLFSHTNVRAERNLL